MDQSKSKDKPFFNRKRDIRTSAADTPDPQIIMSGRPYNRDYTERDTGLTLWLKPSLAQKIDQACAYLDISRSDFLRQILFIHLYGRIDFLGLLQFRSPVAQNEHNDTGVVRSASPTVDSGVKTVKKKDKGPEQNTASVKIWVPAQLKTDLEELAATHKETMSSYARTVISTHLLGHLPYNPDPFAAYLKAAATKK
jgi:hypothetical protein